MQTNSSFLSFAFASKYEKNPNLVISRADDHFRGLFHLLISACYVLLCLVMSRPEFVDNNAISSKLVPMGAFAML